MARYHQSCRLTTRPEQICTYNISAALNSRPLKIHRKQTEPATNHRECCSPLSADCCFIHHILLVQLELALGQGSSCFKGPLALVNTFFFCFPGCGFGTRQKVNVNGGIKGWSEVAAALFSLVYRLKEQRDKEQQRQLAQEPRENTSELGSTQMEFFQRLNKKNCFCAQSCIKLCTCLKGHRYNRLWIYTVYP